MFCSNCGKQLEDGVVYCSFCGNKVNGAASGQPVEPKKKSSKKWVPVVIAVLCLALVGACIGLGYHFIFNSIDRKYEQAMSQAAELVEQEEYKDAIESYKTALEYLEDDEEALEGLSNAYIILAEQYLDDDDYEKAYSYYEKAYKVMDKDEAKVAAWNCCYTLAEDFYADGDYNSFEKWCEKADKLADDVGKADYWTEYYNKYAAMLDPELQPEVEPEIVPEPEPEPVIVPEPEPEDRVINVWSFTDEVPNMIQEYVSTHPDFDYEIRTTIIATTDGMYQPALDAALQVGGSDAPDIYCVESAFATKYLQGDASYFAAPYEDLGIDVDNKIREAGIAEYSVQMGTRPIDGKVVGLAYQGDGGAFIYRRSIALATWGTDDPEYIAEIIGGGSGNWDQFFVAAEELRANGYAIISGCGDIWHSIENSADNGWVVDGKLNIDPKREEYLDIAKKLNDNDYTNRTMDWSDEWYADMKGIGEKQVFGFFGPTWLINYILTPNSGDTYGDWAVCDPPVGFFWGGTWILANNESEHKEAVGDILEWITLEQSSNGLQYLWANDTGWYFRYGGKDAVTSEEAMKISDGTLEFLGGQNMYDVYARANAYAKGNNRTIYDETINYCWLNAVRAYAEGWVERDEAIEQFKQEVSERLGVEVE